MHSQYKHIVDKIRKTGYIIPFMWLVTAVSFGGIATIWMDYYSSYQGVGNMMVNQPEVGWTVEFVTAATYRIAVALMPQAVGALCLYVVIAIRADFTIEKFFIIGAGILGAMMITYDIHTGYQYHAAPAVRDIVIFSEAYRNADAATKALVHNGLGLAVIVDFLLSELIMAVAWGMFWELIPDARTQWRRITGSVAPTKAQLPNKPKPKPQEQQHGPRTDPGYSGRGPRGGGTPINQRDLMNQHTYAAPQPHDE